jgi:hypothetical protein
VTVPHNRVSLRPVIRAAVAAEKAAGSPIIGRAEASVDVLTDNVLRRLLSQGRRGVPNDQALRVRDLLNGLMQHVDPIYVGPLTADYRALAQSIVEAVDRAAPAVD